MTINTMKAAVFKQKGGNLEIVEKPIPEPKANDVRIKVISCGICQGDNVCKFGAYPNTFPSNGEGRVPGHEVIGKIDKLGEGVDGGNFKIGQIVGVGWFGGNQCYQCNECKEDEFVHCHNSLICGIHYDGGYAEYMTTPKSSLVIIPDGMDPIASSPLLCAGLTVFNSFRNQNIKAGSLVGVQGIGGLGHLAIQFCKKMGYKVVAMSNSSDKEQVSKELGADYFVDISKDGFVNEIKSIGKPVNCILVTAPAAKFVQPLIDSLGVNGKLLILAAFPEPFNASSVSLIGGNKSIVGWASGDSRHAEETLSFANSNHIIPTINKFSLDQASDALSNISKSRFRNVIVFE